MFSYLVRKYFNIPKGRGAFPYLSYIGIIRGIIEIIVPLRTSEG